MSQPFVSIIVTTRNNESTLDACLRSIADQTYKSAELIVVDNNSTDQTVKIAKIYTSQVFNKGPERSAQRNYAAQKAQGEYILIIDSDMELDKNVVKDCVESITKDPSSKAVIIPEESFGKGFWAQCKKLERSFYVGQDAIEAARFFPKETFQKLGGYNEAMTGGEDWDLTRRFRSVGTIARANAFIFHNEGRPTFLRTVKKIYYYAGNATAYFDRNSEESALTSPSGPLQRYKLFFSRPGELFKNPFIGLGMLTLKTTEYAAGALGLVKAQLLKAKSRIKS